MKFSRYQFISFLLTTVIFAVLFSYLFGGPKQLLNMPNWDNITSLFKIETPILKTEEKTAKPTSTKISKKNSPPVVSAPKDSKFGQQIDELNGVPVFYNGKVSNISGRNVTSDGYNLGLKYQCVEFVKRYYYEHLKHKMPDSYGNAKDFFNPKIQDGKYNAARGLYQFTNPSVSSPQINDLIIFGPTQYNPFGHVAIVSDVRDNQFEIIQQNPGSGNPSREWFNVYAQHGKFVVDHEYVLGWLRQ